MVSAFAAVLALVGASFSLLAAVGVLRMPDTITRMHAATKVSAFGGGTTLAAAALHFGDPALAARCAVAIGLIMISTPVAAHLLARASRRSGAPSWEHTSRDDYTSAPADRPDDAPDGS